MGLALVLAVLGMLVPSAFAVPPPGRASSEESAQSAHVARLPVERDAALDPSHATAPSSVRAGSGARPRAEGRTVDARDRALQAGVSVARLPVDDLDLEPRHLSWRRSARVSPSRMRADLMVFLN